MYCSNCSKLSILHTHKKCSRCHGTVTNSISILCEFCSLTEKICAACLKKVNNPDTVRKRGCASCGK